MQQWTAALAASLTVLFLGPRPAEACTDAGVCGVVFRPLPRAEAPRSGVLLTECDFAGVTAARIDDGRMLPLASTQHGRILEVRLPPTSTGTPPLTIGLFSPASPDPFQQLVVQVAPSADLTPPVLGDAGTIRAFHRSEDGGCSGSGFFVELTMPRTSEDPPGAYLVYEQLGGDSENFRQAILGAQSASFSPAVELRVDLGEHCFTVEAVDLGGHRSPRSSPLCVSVHEDAGGAVVDAGADAGASTGDAAAADAGHRDLDTVPGTCGCTSTGPLRGPGWWSLGLLLATAWCARRR